MKANYLNQAFNPAQARAIEKYVEGILAAGAKPVEVPAPVVVAEKKPKPVAAPVVAAKPETTEE